MASNLETGDWVPIDPLANRRADRMYGKEEKVGNGNEDEDEQEDDEEREDVAVDE